MKTGLLTADVLLAHHPPAPNCPDRPPQILTEIARGWFSTTAPPPLPRTYEGLMSLRFDKLENSHGKKLVAKVLALLTAARNGLSIQNLVELVSGSDGAAARTRWHLFVPTPFFLSSTRLFAARRPFRVCMRPLTPG